MSNGEDPTVTCDRTDCRVSSTGECAEGHSDLSLCTHYSAAGNALADEEPLPIKQPTLESRDLYLGKELDYASSVQITRNSLSRVIVLAGPNDSGKTTLLASVFDLYLQGPVAGYLFAGSETLPAFDERCHLSRTDSGRQTEDTERTKSFSEETMLHLRVRDSELRRPIQDLLLSDIRGELFRDATNLGSEAVRIKAIHRADHIAVLVDGAKIANLSTRNGVVTTTKTMLRRFVETQLIGRQTCVQILFTKDDLIKATDQANKTTQFLDATVQEIQTRVEPHVGALRFMRIMAREGGGLDSYGVSELVGIWVRESNYLRAMNSAHQDQKLVITSGRDFDLFAYRIPTRQL